MTTRAADTALAHARDLLVVRLNQGVNLLAERDDLIASVLWDPAPGDPPAWFTPADAEVTINGPVALGDTDPAEVNPLTPVGRRRHPVVVGLLCHEASHAHSTCWPPADEFAAALSDTPAAVVKAAVLLEEPRIEKRQLDRRPGDRIYLRAMSQLIIQPGAGSGSATATRWCAAQAALLTAGRVDAGVLDAGDVRAVLAHCRTTLGAMDLAALRWLWRNAIDVADGDLAGLLALAAKWVEVVGVDDPDEVPDPPCLRGSPAAGAAGDPAPPRPEAGDPGDRGPEDAAAGPADPLGAVFRDAMDKAATAGIAEAAAELADGIDDTGDAEAEADRRAAETRERETAREHATRVFDSHSDTGVANPLGPSREPTDEERVLARHLGKALRRAQFRERGRTVVPSPVPPGRLNGRDAMQVLAQRARRMPVTAAPFRQVTRRHTPQPPLTVGIAVDISGSMDWATAIMASTAWIVAHAVAHVGGKSAAVAFGRHVTAVTQPGSVPAKVPSFTATDGTEMFTDAIHALDGGLGLTTAIGARLVFVVSDGHFVAPGEKKRAAAAVRRLTRHGVHVLWLDMHRRAGAMIIPPGATPIPITTIADIPQQVNTILVNALRSQ